MNQSIKRMAKFILLGLCVALLLCAAIYQRPHEISQELSAVCCSDDGEAYRAIVTVQGTWQRRLLGETQVEFKGFVTVGGVAYTESDENWPITLAFSSLSEDTRLFAGGFFHDANARTRGSITVVTEDFSTYALTLMSTDGGAPVRVYAPALSVDEAEALHKALLSDRSE